MVSHFRIMKKLQWNVNVKGAAGEESFEISVVRSDNEHGKISYGWFDERKLLISHNGGPCHWPLTQFVWDRLVAVAEETAAHMNAEMANVALCRPEGGENQSS